MAGLFSKKRTTRSDYLGSDEYGGESSAYSNDVVGNDNFDGSTTNDYYGTNASYGGETTRQRAVKGKQYSNYATGNALDYRWWEFTVIFIEFLLVLYLVLVLTGFAPLL